MIPTRQQLQTMRDMMRADNDTISHAWRGGMHNVYFQMANSGTVYVVSLGGRLGIPNNDSIIRHALEHSLEHN